MTVIHDEGGQPGARTGQSAGVLSAWIDEQLRDIQSVQVAGLARLRARLQSDAFEWDNALLCRAIEVLREEAVRLDFEPLRKRGFLSKLFGSPGRAVFCEQHRRIVEAAKTVQARYADLAGSYRAHTSGARRVLVELDMEQQGMAREVGQAVEWLAEMSDDMAHRLQAGGETPAMALLRKRAEFSAGQLKALHGLQAMAADICVIGQNVLARRTALLEQLKADLDGFGKIWSRRVGGLADPANAAVGPALDKAQATHAELLARLEQTHAAAEALQLEEHVIGLRLAAMRKELDAFA